MNKHFLRFTFFLLICFTLPLPATGQVINIPEPVPPPPTVRDAFDLDPFYQQWIDVEGFPIVASEKVNPYALKEAAWLIRQMIGHRPEVLHILAQKQVRFTVIGYTEILTDIPEYSDQGPDFLTFRTRGLGGGGLSGHIAVSTPEENLLHYPGSNDLYTVMVHEFAHAIDLFGLDTIVPTFDNQLKVAYDAAMEKGLWQGTYAATDRREYWAEGTHAWFYPMGRGSFNNGNTRQALKAYDPGLAALLTEVYGDTGWHYTPPAVRTHLPHLRGFDPQDSPMYRGWPELEELYLQFSNPNSNGDGRWTDLRPYDSSLLSGLNESRTAGAHTTVAFVNRTQANVLIYWVDRDGTEGFWRRLSPDPQHIRWTRSKVNDIWLIKDLNGRDLAVFQAVEQIGRALIDVASILIAPGLSKITGDNQVSMPGAVLANPFVVEVRAENGAALEGISVTFTVVTGGGTLSVTRTMTDANGRAESTLTLGLNLGTNTVEVSAAGIEAPVTFNTVAEAAIDIPDPNLRAAIETALSKAEGKPITPAEMAALTGLNAREAALSDLTGLERATNLKEALLERNDISDISPMVSLTQMAKLRLGGNSISDISPLSGLTQLTRLSLWANSLSDISPVKALTNLTELNLSGNSISSIASVAGLTQLTWLHLQSNSISDIAALAGLTNLTALRLDRNSISDTLALSGLHQLTELRLDRNSITDLSPLVANTGLGKGDKVYVRSNPLSYTSIYAHIPTLQSRGVTVEFDNQAHPALLKISGDNQKGPSFTPLSQPFVVEAQDENGSTLAGVSVTFAVTAGGGTLSTTITRTDANGRAESTLTLGPNLGTNTVEVSAAGIEVPATFHAISDTEAPPIAADINSDGSVNVLDLIVVASAIGNIGANLATDVNKDGVVSILDLILVAGMFNDAAAAPSAQPQVPEPLTAVEVRQWLIDARALEVKDPIMKRGIIMLEQLLIALTPKETELLANYPNPFNPETWIPYRLADDAFVTLIIYNGSGQVVRTLDVGHRIASAYESRSKAIHWDGRNGLGEQVTSGVYFYHLSAGDFSATRKMLILK